MRKVVIPAAGLGTRLYPATKAQPKEMLPLGRKPAIQLVVEEALRAGLDQPLIVTSRSKRAIEDHFDRSDPPPAKAKASLLDEGRTRLLYIRQDGPRGLGDAVNCARDFVGPDHFAVALGDAVVGQRGDGVPLLPRLVRAHVENAADATIAVRRVPPHEVSSYGIVAPAEGATAEVFPLADLVEKPAVEQAPSDWAVTGRYVFSPRVFDYLERTRPGHGGEVQLTDAIRLMVGEGLVVQALRLRPDERRLDVGNFLDYAVAFIEVGLGDAECGDELRARLEAMLGDADEGALRVGEDLPEG